MVEQTYTTKKTPIALTIAGSDSGGGAGIQADLKAFSAMGVYGASVITAITAQNTVAVTDVHIVPTQTISKQMGAVFDDLTVGAVKIGMLGGQETIDCVSRNLAKFSGPIVLDPVMIAKSGDALLEDSAISALVGLILPRASVLTPNLPEAARLLEQDVAQSLHDMERQAHALCALGPAAVLMKGGHAEGSVCTDLLVLANGEIITFQAERVVTRNTHGTGCTLSAAIAAGLAQGLSVIQAVEYAHRYLQGAIRNADSLTIGSGHGPVHHFHEWWARA